MEKGRENEELVAEHYRKQGYQVINTNETGLPDLIVLKDKQVLFFVEVKAQGVSLNRFQDETITKWEKEGFETKVIHVGNGKILL